jgi:hypothetical protein
MNLTTHLRLLEWHIWGLSRQKSNLPVMFEYYSAIHLTKRFRVPFHVWKDIPSKNKTDARFHVQDPGVDAADDTFSILGKSKYYAKGKVISYGKISNFLATPLLVGRKDMALILIRTRHSCLDYRVSQIVKKGDIFDIPLDEEDFLLDIEDIKKSF